MGNTPAASFGSADAIAGRALASEHRVASICAALMQAEDLIASLQRIAAWETDPERAARLFAIAGPDALPSVLGRIAAEVEAAAQEMDLVHGRP